MQYTPLTDEQLEAMRPILKEGPAKFFIKNAEEHIKPDTGAQSVKLIVQAWDRFGTEGLLFEYLSANAVWKIKELLISINKKEDYECGDLPAPYFINRSGYCLIGMGKSSGNYPAKMQVKKWLNEDEYNQKLIGIASDEMKSSKNNNIVLPDEDDMDDGIPF